MRKFLLASVLLMLSGTLLAQVPYSAGLPNGYTKKATISEQVGLAVVSISYNRPAVNGREGKIWGQVVPVGFVNQGFGNGKLTPWRAGANENTIIEFSDDVKIEGQALPKGKYGLFIAYDPVESIFIFSRKSDAWGSFFYEDKEDALRVKVKPQPLANNVENLKYEFINQKPNSAVVALQWEKLSIPFKVEVDFLKQQYEALLTESQNPRGFTWQGLNIAANWTLQNNYKLEKGLEWASLASGTTFPGDPTSYTALLTKASILLKLGKGDEAMVVLKKALPFGNPNQLLQLGRQLIAAKNTAGAMEVFQYSYDKNPNQFISLVGMARAHSAKGDYAKAAEYATKALPLAPNDANKQGVQGMIDKLKAGSDIN